MGIAVAEIAAGNALGGTTLAPTISVAAGTLLLKKGDVVVGALEAATGIRKTGTELAAIVRQDEVARLFAPATNRFDTILVDGKQFAYDKTNTGGARIFDGVSEAQVKRYFEDLTGVPLSQAKQSPVGYYVQTPSGNFNLRSSSSSADTTKAKWTIDVPQAFVGTTKDVELKFR